MDHNEPTQPTTASVSVAFPVNEPTASPAARTGDETPSPGKRRTADVVQFPYVNTRLPDRVDEEKAGGKETLPRSRKLSFVAVDFTLAENQGKASDELRVAVNPDAVWTHHGRNVGLRLSYRPLQKRGVTRYGNTLSVDSLY